jgi:luciferase family oxidoreductase group 1
MASKRITLSGLDLQWPGTFTQSARQLELLGYRRYWATEHHSMMQSASPVIAVAVAAQQTSTIRLGTAGILLHYHAPRKVAEDFALLRLVCGGRLDLGVVSAQLNAKSIHLALLDGRRPGTPQSFAAKVTALVTLMAGEELVYSGTTQDPTELWVCGQSPESAALAGRLGMFYAFHHYAAINSGASLADGRRIIEAYLSTFRATSERCPSFAIACFGLCACTRAKAAGAWQRLRGERRQDPTPPVPAFLGGAEECHDQLSAIAEAYGASELVIECMTRNHAQRMRSFEMLASEFALA